jgi:hypothetical protein
VLQLARHTHSPIVQIAHTGKRLDLFSDNVDTTVVTGVQLQHHLPHVFFAIYPSRESENSRSLSGSGRSVEKEMWQAL